MEATSGPVGGNSTDYVEDALALDTFLSFARSVGLPYTPLRGLELGCGAGARSQLIARHVAEYVGVDPDAVAIRQAAQANAGHPSCRFSVGADARAGDSGTRTFDLIVCDLERLRVRPGEGLRVIAEVLGLLSPGGLALFEMPPHRSARERALARLRRGGRSGSVEVTWPDAAREARRQHARLLWVDKHRRRGTLYCAIRDELAPGPAGPEASGRSRGLFAL